jgi:hypothetical protein
MAIFNSYVARTSSYGTSRPPVIFLQLAVEMGQSDGLCGDFTNRKWMMIGNRLWLIG